MKRKPEAGRRVAVVGEEGFSAGGCGIGFMSRYDKMTRAQLIRKLEAHGDGACREERLRFFDLSRDLLCVVGFDGMINLYNPACEKVMGYTPDELRRNPYWTFIHPDDRARAREAMRRLAAGESPSALEVRMRGRDREYKWLMWHAQLFAEDEVIYFAGRDITEHKHVEAELSAAEARYRELSVHLRSVVENERARIAREIHDELGSLLTAIKIELGWHMGRRGEEPGSVEHGALFPLSWRIDAAITMVNRIATGLRPSILDTLGVWAAIEWLAEDTMRRTGIVVELVFDPPLLEIDLGAERATALFRIVQEALTNVTRHADASKVTVHVAKEPCAVRLTVIDNGVGIDSALMRNPGSYGIIGMMERTTALGGTFSIDLGDRGGTRVAITIPMT